MTATETNARQAHAQRLAEYITAAGIPATPTVDGGAAWTDPDDGRRIVTHSFAEAREQLGY